MIEEGLPEGKYRLEIYECIKGVIQRDLTEAEHKYLSHILKMYANTAREHKALITKPVEHKWVCTKCTDELTTVGKKENHKQVQKAIKNRKRIQKAEQNTEV